MVTKIFLGLSLAGAQWVLILLIVLSVVSIGLILERVLFYRMAEKGLKEFRGRVRSLVGEGKHDAAFDLVSQRVKQQKTGDLETAVTQALLSPQAAKAGKEALPHLAQDAVIRARILWEKNLGILATIGNNAPFVGLFGTVLGIIKAFHELSEQQNAGIHAVSGGISEALVATAIGIGVAVPAVVAFNFFQKKMKKALLEAEAMKGFLVAMLNRR